MIRLVCLLLGHKFTAPEYVAGYDGRRAARSWSGKGMYRGRWCIRCESVVDLGDLPRPIRKSDCGNHQDRFPCRACGAYVPNQCPRYAKDNALASVDTHAKRGDAAQTAAPSPMSGAVPAKPGDAQ